MWWLEKVSQSSTEPFVHILWFYYFNVSIYIAFWARPTSNHSVPLRFMDQKTHPGTLWELATRYIRALGNDSSISLCFQVHWTWIIGSLEEAHISEITHSTYQTNCVDKQGKISYKGRGRWSICCYSLNRMKRRFAKWAF